MRFNRAALAVVFIPLLAVACSSGHSGSKDTSDGEPTVTPTSGASNQGGETNPADYTDTRFNYSLHGPGKLKPQPDGTAVFVGEDERLEVAVVQGSTAADPLALAQSDLGSLKGSTTDFQVLVQPTSVSVGSQRGAKFTYSYTAQSHFGKQAKFFGVRYYIPKNPAMLAVMTYRDLATEFDAGEADGFANSFKWL